jgi:hypothetical protein
LVLATLGSSWAGSGSRLLSLYMLHVSTHFQHVFLLHLQLQPHVAGAAALYLQVTDLIGEDMSALGSQQHGMHALVS